MLSCNANKEAQSESYEHVYLWFSNEQFQIQKEMAENGNTGSVTFYNGKMYTLMTHTKKHRTSFRDMRLIYEGGFDFDKVEFSDY